MSTMNNHNEYSNRGQSAYSGASGFDKSESSIGNLSTANKSFNKKPKGSKSEYQKAANLSLSKSEDKSKTTCFITGFSPEESQDQLLSFLSQFSPHITGLSIPKKG